MFVNMNNLGAVENINGDVPCGVGVNRGKSLWSAPNRGSSADCLANCPRIGYTAKGGKEAGRPLSVKSRARAFRKAI